MVLHELLIGCRPYEAPDETATLDLITEARPPKPLKLRPNLAKNLGAVVTKSLAKRPKDRYSDANELRNALLEFVDDRLANRSILSALVQNMKKLSEDADKATRHLPSDKA